MWPFLLLKPAFSCLAHSGTLEITPMFYSLFPFFYFFRSDSNNVCNSASVTSVTASTASNTTAMNRGTASNPVTIAAQMNITTNTVNITSPISLQHPVTITAPMNIAHPVAITSPMSMNITGPLNIAMRPMESMSFLSQVLPSSPPW